MALLEENISYQNEFPHFDAMFSIYWKQNPKSLNIQTLQIQSLSKYHF